MSVEEQNQLSGTKTEKIQGYQAYIIPLLPMLLPHTKHHD